MHAVGWFFFLIKRTKNQGLRKKKLQIFSEARQPRPAAAICLKSENVRGVVITLHTIKN
jgi:hypothetical protein